MCGPRTAAHSRLPPEAGRGQAHGQKRSHQSAVRTWYGLLPQRPGGRWLLSQDGEGLALSAPQVIPASAAEPLLASADARRGHRLGMAHYLSLKTASPVQRERAPDATTRCFG